MVGVDGTRHLCYQHVLSSAIARAAPGRRRCPVALTKLAYRRATLCRPIGAVSSNSLRFVDLFAGLGGFHVALMQLGHSCVFACEIDEVSAMSTPRTSDSAGRRHSKVDLGDVPAHDILCAGFPCQPFSKAGEQTGSIARNARGLV